MLINPLKSFAILRLEDYVHPMKAFLLAAVGAIILVLAPAETVQAEFSDSVLGSVRNIQEKILLRVQRNITGADASTMWSLFDQDVLRSLNGGVIPLSTEALNRKYGWTDIRIPLTYTEKKGEIKTGAIRIRFYPLPSRAAGRSDWLAVYYHGFGAVPSATFHIFRYKNNRYIRAAAMEESDFLHKNDNLQWNGIQVQKELQPGHFSTYFTPATSSKSRNRVQAHWHWNGKKLKVLRWYPEVDFRKTKDGTYVSGRGAPVSPD